ncbi:MAG: hypothetical protein RR461_03085 [Angelakisella sp.]
MVLYATFAIILFGVAVYHFGCAIADVPTAKTSRMMLLSRKQVGYKGEKLFEVYITRISGWIARFIRMEPLRRGKLQAALDISGMQIAPETYLVKAFVTAFLVSFTAFPAFFIQPLFALVAIGIAVTMFFATYQKVFDDVKKRRKIIEAEIPRFVATLAQSLQHTRDVLKILTSYRRVAGKELGAQIDRTIADMKTGNYEQALLRMESRVGSTLMSDVVRGLIGTLRGDDQHMYMQMLVFDMRQIEQSNLKKEVAKRPKQIQKYSMMMLFCIIILYVVVLSVEVMSSLGAFF